MKHLLAAALIAVPGLAFADANGVWQTQTSEEGNYLHVTISDCAGNPSQTCGVITGAYDGSGAANNPHLIGERIIWDMTGNGTRYSGGTIWAPDNDREYSSNMELSGSGNELEVEGCVLFICRGQTWTRVQ